MSAPYSSHIPRNCNYPQPPSRHVETSMETQRRSRESERSVRGGGEWNGEQRTGSSAATAARYAAPQQYYDAAGLLDHPSAHHFSAVPGAPHVEVTYSGAYETTPQHGANRDNAEVHHRRPMKGYVAPSPSHESHVHPSLSSAVVVHEQRCSADEHRPSHRCLVAQDHRSVCTPSPYSDVQLNRKFLDSQPQSADLHLRMPQRRSSNDDEAFAHRRRGRSGGSDRPSDVVATKRSRSSSDVDPAGESPLHRRSLSAQTQRRTMPPLTLHDERGTSIASSMQLSSITGDKKRRTENRDDVSDRTDSSAHSTRSASTQDVAHRDRSHAAPPSSSSQRISNQTDVAALSFVSVRVGDRNTTELPVGPNSSQLSTSSSVLPQPQVFQYGTNSVPRIVPAVHTNKIPPDQKPPTGRAFVFSPVETAPRDIIRSVKTVASSVVRPPPAPIVSQGMMTAIVGRPTTSYLGMTQQNAVDEAVRRATAHTFTSVTVGAVHPGGGTASAPGIVAVQKPIVSTVTSTGPLLSPFSQRHEPAAPQRRQVTPPRPRASGALWHNCCLLVFDTSSLIFLADSLRDFDRLLKIHRVGIPFVALGELDKLCKGGSDADEPNSKRAERARKCRQVRDWLMHRFAEEEEAKREALRRKGGGDAVGYVQRLRLQSRLEVDEEYNKRVQVNDDAILGYAVFLRRVRKEADPIVFVTEDKMLELKAAGEQFPCVAVSKLLAASFHN